MTQSRQETYDWYDDADALEAPRTDISALPGIPGAWQNLHWWMAGIVFSALWMLESWSGGFAGTEPRRLPRGKHLDPAAFIEHLLRHLQVQQSHNPRHWPMCLCAVSAVVLLLNHAFNV